MKKFSLIAILTLQAILTSALALATDDGDLYPNLSVAASKVKGEYDLAAEAFNHANPTATQVMAVVSPGSLSCTYYMGNYRRKDNAELVITKGRIGAGSRSISVLGMQIQVMPPRNKNEGPWVEAKINSVKYKLEMRLGNGDAAGTLLIAVGQTNGGLNFNKSQYLVCDVGGAAPAAEETAPAAEGPATAADLQQK